MAEFTGVEGLEEKQREIRENATPKQRAFLEEFDRQFAAACAEFDRSIDLDNAIRKWVKELTGVSATISDAENMVEAFKECDENAFFRFKIKGVDVFLFKDQAGNVHNARRYLHTLECTVIDLSKKCKVQDNDDSVTLLASDLKTLYEDRARLLAYTELGFLGLIKLAFSQLLKGRLFDGQEEGQF